MSRVFLAEEAQFKRKVVIKVLSPELAAGISAERFEREIKLAAQLQQANIVEVHAAGEVGGLPYYMMPFVEGESLRTRLGRGQLSLSESVAILRDVARALACAHSKGVVHRDIKPENVLLSGDAAVVTDFGIAKAVSESKTNAPGGTLTVVGTSKFRGPVFRESQLEPWLRSNARHPEIGATLHIADAVGGKQGLLRDHTLADRSAPYIVSTIILTRGRSRDESRSESCSTQ